MSPAEFRRLVVQTLPVAGGNVERASTLVRQVESLSDTVYARRLNFVTRVVASWVEGIKHITSEERADRAQKKFCGLLETACDGGGKLTVNPEIPGFPPFSRNILDWQEKGFTAYELAFFRKIFEEIY
jgi:hypothetical protein